MNNRHLRGFIEEITLDRYEFKDGWIYDTTERAYVGRVENDKVQLIYGEYPNSSLTRDMFILREELQSWELPFEEVVSVERMKTLAGTVEEGKKGAMEHFRAIGKEFLDLADRVNNMDSIETPEI